MANYLRLFTKFLDQKQVNYDVSRDNVVSVSFRGDNLKSIAIKVIFDEDGDEIVQFKCWTIANFSEKKAAGIMACNDINNQYRWVKFCIDDDADVCASADTYIDENTCGIICYHMVNRMVNIIDDTYPIFARALWS